MALDELQTAADTYDFSSAVMAFKAQKVGGVLLLLDFMATRESDWIAAAAEHRLPTIYADPHAAERGGLIGYGENLGRPHQTSRTAGYKGSGRAKAADLPIELPTVLKLVINLTTARRLGMTIPPSLLLQADQLIG